MNKNTFFKLSISGAEGSAHTKRAIEERRDGASLLEEPQNAVCQSLPDKCYLWSIFSFAKPSVFTAADGMCMYGGASCALVVLSVDTFKKKSVLPCETLLWACYEILVKRLQSGPWHSERWLLNGASECGARIRGSFESACRQIFFFFFFWSALSSMFAIDLCVDNSVLIMSDRADC